MDRRKMVIVGAGSTQFTANLLADLIRAGKPWRVGLVDIDPAALATAQQLGQRMVEAREADVVLEASTERGDLLPDADVVVTTIGVGGRRAWETDVRIPREYGVYQPIGDTIMAGGISRAMRMVPAMVDIARDVLRLCPRALFFNYANPMTVNCWAVRRATGAEITGLCIGAYEVYEELAHLIEAPLEEVTWLAAGINHFTWIYDLRRRGQDAWPLVRDKLAAARGESTEGALIDYPLIGSNPFSWSLFEAYGAYPACSDVHVTEFFPERLPGGRYAGGTLGVDVYSAEGNIGIGDATYEYMQAQARGEVPLDQEMFEHGAGEQSQLVEIVEAIAGDSRAAFTANLPNRGTVPNLPAEAILETTAVATARGLRPLQVPDMADALAAPLRRKLAGQALTVEAALTGSRQLFVEALLADGCIAERPAAERLADDLLKAHRQYLPHFE